MEKDENKMEMDAQQLLQQLSWILDGRCIHHKGTNESICTSVYLEFVRDIASAVAGTDADRPAPVSAAVEGAVTTFSTPQSSSTADCSDAQESIYSSAFLMMDGNLAIAATALKPIYKYAWHLLSTLDLSWISSHSNVSIVDRVPISSIASDENPAYKTIAEASQALVLINPECYTAWNARKHLICQGFIDPLDEFHYTSLLLSKHRKSSIVWAHRFWIRSHLSSDILCTLLPLDINVCQQAADSYKRNYPAWTYRMKIAGSPSKDYILAELSTVRKWTKMHVSDYSGWNYCQWLLSRLAELDPQSDQVAQQLIQELNLVHSLIDMCSGHESLWNHLRFVSKLAATIFHNWCDPAHPCLDDHNEFTCPDTAIDVVYDPDLYPTCAQELLFAQAIAATRPSDRPYALVLSFIFANELKHQVLCEKLKSILAEELPHKVFFGSM
ncbi:hypothetical protein BSLG_002632 [Batrachochytrium salamandrivorans]|nr:hypothetical protein BSLG_002632 [Batrachochytrium salamandrivorans]